MSTLVWFREDLRTADNPALSAALTRGGATVALYIYEIDTRAPGAAAKWWLHHSLTSLQQQLAGLQIPLIIAYGQAAALIPAIIRSGSFNAVAWNRRYGAAKAADRKLRRQLAAAGVEVLSFPGNLLFEPWDIVTGKGDNYKVFSAFWRACSARPAPPLLTPERLRPSSHAALNTRIAEELAEHSCQLRELNLLPTNPDWAQKFHEIWSPGETAAHDVLADFLASDTAAYEKLRDYPAETSTSALSPHLRWGEISSRQVFQAACASGKPVTKFLSELGWREFAWHTLFYNPQMADKPLNQKFASFGWCRDPEPRELAAWQRGETGYALVDAGMNELWCTGTMHNRVRMVTASFLTKNMLIDWRLGERWFWDTLVDADEASNPFNWQWVAGCGADAAPYFRIFNPETQLRRFDPQGEYVNRWAELLTEPILDLQESRARALAAYEEIKDDK